MHLEVIIIVHELVHQTGLKAFAVNLKGNNRRILLVVQHCNTSLSIITDCGNFQLFPRWPDLIQVSITLISRTIKATTQEKRNLASRKGDLNNLADMQ